MPTLTDRLTNKEATKFIDQVADLFKTLPHLPEGIVEFLVKIAPYLALIGAVLSIIAGPLIAIFGSLGSLLLLNPFLLVATLVSAALIVVQAIILFMAFTPLKNREMKGWILAFWAEIIGIGTSLLTGVTSFNATSLLWSVFWGVLWLYVLVEMRPKYK